MKYSLEKMVELTKQNKTIEATMGGLIIGRSHDEGGIYIWVKRGEHYVLEAEVEGYEFILNTGATHYFSNITNHFHQYKRDKHDFVEYEPPSQTKTLDTRTSFDAKYLLFDTGGFAVINKYSTKGYLNTLDQMNKAITFRDTGNGQASLVYNDFKDIELKFYNKTEGIIKVLSKI